MDTNNSLTQGQLKTLMTKAYERNLTHEDYDLLRSWVEHRVESDPSLQKEQKNVLPSVPPNLSIANAVIWANIEYKIVTVNPEKVEILGAWGRPLKFRKHRQYYTVTFPGGTIGAKCGKQVYVHRVIAYCLFGEKIFEEGVNVDHINGDTLDNRPENLRLLSLSKNVTINNRRRIRRKKPQQ